MLEIYAELNKQINGVKETVAANRDRADERLFGTYEKLNNKIDFNKSLQDGVNASQLAYNGTNSATIACMQGQIAQLQGMTKTVIPNSALCPGVPAVYVTHTNPLSASWLINPYSNFSVFSTSNPMTLMSTTAQIKPEENTVKKYTKRTRRNKTKILGEA